MHLGLCTPSLSLGAGCEGPSCAMVRRLNRRPAKVIGLDSLLISNNDHGKSPKKCQGLKFDSSVNTLWQLGGCCT